MDISAAQCRAARALLEWTQDQLAENAHLGRATVADFERNVRMPMRNNIIALRNTLEAAGVEFIPENGAGAGVRFRKVEMEYSKDVQADDDGVIVRVRYRGKGYKVRIPRAVINDLNGSSHGTPEQLVEAVAKRLPVFLHAAENILAHGNAQGYDTIILTRDKFESGLFG